jgi:hypothetical protein
MKSERLKRLILPTMLVLALATLMVFADALINAPDTSAVDSDMVPQLPPSERAMLNLHEPAKVLALYSHFDVLKSDSDIHSEDPKSQQQAGLSAEEQELQQGLLRQLYIGNEVYRLSAVVNHRQYMANLTVTDASSPKTPPRRLGLKAGDKLQQYEVVSVGAKRITFRHQQRELWLQLFNAEQAASAGR